MYIRVFIFVAERVQHSHLFSFLVLVDYHRVLHRVFTVSGDSGAHTGIVAPVPNNAKNNLENSRKQASTKQQRKEHHHPAAVWAAPGSECNCNFYGVRSPVA